MILAEWARRLWYLLNRGRFDAALRAEMEAHRDALPDPRRFGNVLRQREAAADVWGWRWLDDAVHDTRFAWRSLRRAPGVTLVMVLTLALATGATTAIFGIVNGVILRPLPFQAPDRLVQVYGRNWSEDRGTVDPVDGPVAPAQQEAYAQARALDGLAAYDVRTAHIAGRDGVERVAAVMVDAGLFTLLGAEPLVGRVIAAGESVDAVVISEALWRRRFAADPSISGRVVTIDDRPRTVIGVMPERFQFPYRAASILRTALPESRTDVWLPMDPLRGASGAALRRGRTSVVGRLRPGVTLGAAQAELTLIAARAQAQLANPKARIGVRLAPLADVVVGPIRRSLWMLWRR